MWLNVFFDYESNADLKEIIRFHEEETQLDGERAALIVRLAKELLEYREKAGEL